MISYKRLPMFVNEIVIFIKFTCTQNNCVNFFFGFVRKTYTVFFYFCKYWFLYCPFINTEEWFSSKADDNLKQCYTLKFAKRVGENEKMHFVSFGSFKISLNRHSDDDGVVCENESFKPIRKFSLYYQKTCLSVSCSLGLGPASNIWVAAFHSTSKFFISTHSFISIFTKHWNLRESTNTSLPPRF